MRVAFFGGSFDPMHRAHLAIAHAAADAFGMDEVLFAPTGRQPLKAMGPEASFADRVAMARIACTTAGEFGCRLSVSEIDAPKPDGTPNFTVDTLRELRGMLPDAMLFAVAGADSFLTLRRWREPDALLDLAEWIVVSRPGYPLVDFQAALGLSAREKERVHVLETVHENVSASLLRSRLRSGEGCSDWIAPPVLNYIRAHRLYTALL